MFACLLNHATYVKDANFVNRKLRISFASWTQLALVATFCVCRSEQQCCSQIQIRLEFATYMFSSCDRPRNKAFLLLSNKVVAELYAKLCNETFVLFKTIVYATMLPCLICLKITARSKAEVLPIVPWKKFAKNAIL